MAVTRREFLKIGGAGALLAGLPAGWAGGVWASDGPETPKLRIGIIALTDCSSIVMAHELGLFKKHGIESTISKEASWAVIRDRLALGENHATHMLYGMPYASTMGLGGSPVRPMIIPFAINHNGQGITLKKEFLEKGIKTPQQLKPLVVEAKGKGSPMTFAMTYPPGTHAMWMRYWLGAGGINPDRDVALITIPPPQMVANMKVGKMDGLCVGEPWNARAISDGIGFTAITSQQIWKDHPEKVLAFTEEFAAKNPKTVKATMRAMLEASQWCDKLENRPRMAGGTRPLTVRWSGCPASCGNHHTADVGLQGCKVKVDGTIVDGVHVFVGGRGGAKPRAGVRILQDVPCDELPHVLERLLKFFPRGERKDGP